MILTKENDSSFEIAGPAGALETRFAAATTNGVLAPSQYVVIICHPHPLHGGTMDNKVVTTLMRTYRDLGVNVVSFNFRGVGASDGEYDHAVGEVDDLLAVANWVGAQLPQSKLLLAGFSFGSSVAAQACYRLKDVQHLLLVAPPVERYPYDQAGRFPCSVCVVQGDKDERVNASGVYAWIQALDSPAELVRYPDAGHFFHGGLSQMKKDLSDILPSQLKNL
jgi:alpha/beta superfamily hydrolase